MILEGRQGRRYGWRKDIGRSAGGALPPVEPPRRLMLIRKIECQRETGGFNKRWRGALYSWPLSDILSSGALVRPVRRLWRDKKGPWREGHAYVYEKWVIMRGSGPFGTPP